MNGRPDAPDGEELNPVVYVPGMPRGITAMPWAASTVEAVGKGCTGRTEGAYPFEGGADFSGLQMVQENSGAGGHRKPRIHGATYAGECMGMGL